MNRGTRGLNRRTPLRPVRDPHTTAARTPDAALDLAAAAIALARQAASQAAPRRDHQPVAPPTPATPKPTSTGFPPVVRQTILDRDHYVCWRCGLDTTDAVRNLQHRANRGAGGTRDHRINLPSNGMVLCGTGTTGGHGWVEANPAEAERLGYAVQSWADPATVPVLHVSLGWMILDTRGARHLAGAVAPVSLAGADATLDAHAFARRQEPLR